MIGVLRTADTVLSPPAVQRLEVGVFISGAQQRVESISAFNLKRYDDNNKCCVRIIKLYSYFLITVTKQHCEQLSGPHGSGTRSFKAVSGVRVSVDEVVALLLQDHKLTNTSALQREAVTTEFLTGI
jgi:hypothetical protein